MKRKSHKAVAYAVTVICLFGVVVVLIFPRIRNGQSPEGLSYVATDIVCTAIVNYVRDTGQIPPTDNRLSQILFGHNSIRIAFLDARSNPVDQAGYFLDGYGYRLKVIISDDDVIVETSDGKIRFQRKLIRPWLHLLKTRGAELRVNS